ncbi:hypothetical protein BU15DRAFT_80718 [Melanogaster broomeanus]|nr:hypothetical protein BU15DRAFT_80718 [Melanogaster broomeanus]
MDIDDSTATLPPRMRKPWGQPPPSEAPQDPPPRDPGQGADKGEIWGWRRSGGGRDDPKECVSVGSGSAKANGDGDDGADTEFDTETEADVVDDTRQMPPPPMPASLDPTTVSSLVHAYGGRSLSPRVPAHWEKNGSPSGIPPIPTSATMARTSQPPHTSQGYHMAAPAPPQSSPPCSSSSSQAHPHDALSTASLHLKQHRLSHIPQHQLKCTPSPTTGSASASICVTVHSILEALLTFA